MDVVKGYFFGLPPKFASKALKSNQDNGFFFVKNIYQNKVWHCFNDSNRYHDAPKSQVVALKAGSTVEEKKKIAPEVPDDFFRQRVLNHLKDYIFNNESEPSSPKKPALPTNESTNDSINGAPIATSDTNSSTLMLC